MPNYQSDLGVPPCHDPPGEVLQHTIVFVLPATVVCMEEHLHLAQAMSVEEVVKLANDCIGPLAASFCLIAEEVNLPCQCLTVYPKHSTLPGS